MLLGGESFLGVEGIDGVKPLSTVICFGIGPEFIYFDYDAHKSASHLAVRASLIVAPFYRPKQTNSHDFSVSLVALILHHTENSIERSTPIQPTVQAALLLTVKQRADGGASNGPRGTIIIHMNGDEIRGRPKLRSLWSSLCWGFVVTMTMTMIRPSFARRNIPSFLRTKSSHGCHRRILSIPQLRSTRLWSSLGEEEQELDRIKQRVNQLVEEQPLNLESPRLVSRAIFGGEEQQCVNRYALEKAIPGLGDKERQIAELVLQYRQLKGKVQKQKEKQNDSIASVGTRAFSSQNSDAPSEMRAIDEVDLPVVSDQSSFFSKPYAEQVERIFQPGSQIDEYWKEVALKLQKPAAQVLVGKLVATCPLGYDYSNGTSDKKPAPPLVSLFQEKRKEHPDRIVLMRVGEFYETYGLDSILLVEYAGLNPMGTKVRAGCPKNNIQQTLDSLTSQGFVVAVYEESSNVQTGQKATLKDRFLSGVVSPAMPVYLFGQVLKTNADYNTHDIRPLVGVFKASSGYTIVSVNIADHTVRVFERLTKEAAASHFFSNPPARPIWYVQDHADFANDKGAESLKRLLPISDSGEREGRIKILKPTELPDRTQFATDAEWCKSIIVEKIIKAGHLEEVAKENTNGEDTTPKTLDDFRLIVQPLEMDGMVATQPLSMETAKQIGLMKDKTIPDLLPYVLPAASPKGAKDLAREMLLKPRPPKIASAFANLVKFASDENTAPFPKFKNPNIPIVSALIRKKQASAEILAETWKALDVTKKSLELLGDEVGNLLALTHFESGIGFPSKAELLRSCDRASKCIEEVIAPELISPDQSKCKDSPSYHIRGVPEEFFDNHEDWRGRVCKQSVKETYEKVEDEAQKLGDAVCRDYLSHEAVTREGNKSDRGRDKDRVKYARQDEYLYIENALFRDLHKESKLTEPFGVEDFFEPRNSKNIPVKARRITKNVQESCKAYIAACDEARDAVTSELESLSRTLYKEEHMPAIVQALFVNLVLSTAFEHARFAKEQGWTTAKVNDRTNDTPKDYMLHLKTVWPYWLTKSQSTSNSVEMNGMWLLTAPNMSGKSTIMRAIASASLLSVCGFCAPLGSGSDVDRFDHLNVRGATSDVPAEGKSAFGAEMSDIASLLKTCGRNSLVREECKQKQSRKLLVQVVAYNAHSSLIFSQTMVDELCRGTSPREGTALASSVLEEMLEKKMTGIFATHLHDILDYPSLCESKRLSKKKMSFGDSDEQRFHLEEGECRDSRAIVTARQMGVPEHVRLI